MTDPARRIFGDDWWPEGVQHPRLRLALGLSAAPLLTAALGVVFAFMAAGTNFADEAMVFGQVAQITGLLIIAFPTYAATFGLASVLGLWAARRRSILVFALAGAIGGGLFAAAASAILGHPLGSLAVGFFAVSGLCIMLIARAIAGIRAVPRT